MGQDLENIVPRGAVVRGAVLRRDLVCPRDSRVPAQSSLGSIDALASGIQGKNRSVVVCDWRSDVVEDAVARGDGDVNGSIVASPGQGISGQESQEHSNRQHFHQKLSCPDLNLNLNLSLMNEPNQTTPDGFIDRTRLRRGPASASSNWGVTSR